MGAAATVPKVTLPSAVALVSEGSAHAEFDDVAPDPVTLKRAGSWSDLSAEAYISTSLAEISQIHARIVARNIDKATVYKIEHEADAGNSIDQALTTVAAEAGVDVSRLWIIGDPESIAGLAGAAVFAATNASDLGSYATNYGGARLYSTPTASVDKLTVFYPGGFHAFATALASGVVVDPTTGVQKFGQWQHFGIGIALAGAAVYVGGTAN